MKYKFRATGTFTMEYEADPRDYGTSNVDEMLAIDLEYAQDDPYGFFADVSTVDVTIEPVDMENGLEDEEDED